jgi:hypothetical protein
MEFLPWVYLFRKIVERSRLVYNARSKWHLPEWQSLRGIGERPGGKGKAR